MYGKTFGPCGRGVVVVVVVGASSLFGDLQWNNPVGGFSIVLLGFTRCILVSYALGP